jgi:hypothetical protein
MDVIVKSTLAIIALGLGLAWGCAPKEPASQPASEIGGGSLPPEVSVRPERSGEWELAADARLVLAADGRLELRRPDDAITLAEETLELPAISADGARVAFAFRKPREVGTAVAVAAFEDGEWTGPRVLVARGTPDRVAISPDGRRVAYVAAAGGIAAVWIAPFDGGEPVQLTNLGVREDGPGEPEGFVPVPHREPPRFAGDRLVWESADGEHQVVLP